jgi:hypothetical protein
VNGSALYGIDAKVPGTKIATLAVSPAFGGRLRSVEAGKAMAVRYAGTTGARADNASAKENEWLKL